MSYSERHQRLIAMMETYVSGQNRSGHYVRQIEGEFAQHLSDDERFGDLEYALAMFGADGYDDIEELLARECVWALKTLSGVCVYKDCQSPIAEGSRFCPLHQPG
jgi:hypothetical protein